MDSGVLLITSLTPIQEAIDALTRRGCPDLTSRINQNHIGRPQAAGAFSDIFLGKLDDGRTVAIKSARLYAGDTNRTKKWLKQTTREIYQWQKMGHRNVLPLLGFAIFRDRLSMVTPWANGGTVREYLRVSNPNADRFQLCIDVCEGLCYLHTHALIHGDVKGANVVVDSEGRAMLIDFGSAQLEYASLVFSEMSNAGITFRWAAPELIMESGARQTKASDVYGYGMTVLEILTEDYPFNHLRNEPALFMVIARAELPKRPDINLDDDSWLILTSCWSRSPSNRPTMEEVRSDLQAIRAKREQLSAQPNPDPWHMRLGITSPEPDAGSAEWQHQAPESPQADTQTGGESPPPTEDTAEGRPEDHPEESPVAQPEVPVQEAGKPTIRTTTPLEEIIDILTENGCANLTTQIVIDNPVINPFTEGGFADVYKGVMRNGTVVAIKQLKQLDPNILLPKDISAKMHKRTARELHHWSQLDHDNVIPLLGLAMFQGRLSMISEWMSGGDLRRYLDDNPQVDRIKLCIDIGAGLCHLHGHGMVHGDLKGKNVMVSKEGIAMIGDFGTALMTDLPIYFTKTLQQAPNSFRWTAPEILMERDAKATKESDVYSYGMTILETLTGELPYSDEIAVRVMGMKASGELPPRPDIGLLDDVVWQTLLMCWEQVPKQRIKVNDIMVRMHYVARVGVKLPVCQKPQLENLDYIDGPPDATTSYYEHYHQNATNFGLSAVESTGHSDLSHKHSTEYYTALTKFEEDR